LEFDIHLFFPVELFKLLMSCSLEALMLRLKLLVQCD
jgi:hypothetical protein